MTVNLPYWTVLTRLNFRRGASGRTPRRLFFYERQILKAAQRE